jgi:hypothetical protein
MQNFKSRPKICFSSSNFLVFFYSDIDTLTCDGEWSATCDGNCQKTYSITTRRADHITVCPHPHGKKKSCTGDDCGNVGNHNIF